MRGAARRRLRGAAGLALALLGPPAAAHPLAPALLELHERAGGRVEVRWKQSRLQPAGVELEPELPAHCEALGAPRVESDAASATRVFEVDCGARGLVGAELGVTGLDRSASDALLSLSLADGRSVRAVLSRGAARLVVPERQKPRQVFADYLELGLRHILTGLDHLLFVLGLVLLVSDTRRLVATVTAFTLGHSVTLSLAALGVVHFPPRPIELAIAGSIFVLAVELARGEAGEASALRRRPWAMALLFGLLHGFGFAGALAEIGLPAGEIPLALFSFNAGIELGQLAFVAAALALRPPARALLRAGPGLLARAPAYAIGSLAAYWCLERAAAMLPR